MEAICDWASSEYDYPRDEHAPSRISFDRMYDQYLGCAVGKSVTKANFAKSVFYTTAKCPDMDEAGEFYYSESSIACWSSS
jgi:hypothetical protein